MIILAIETSCDETAAAVVRINGKKAEVISSIISSQTKLHADWGGVVPNLAAREHLKNILPVIKYSLRKAKLRPNVIDLIAVTLGPGLIPALLIGTNTARTLSYVWKKPLLGVHHVEGHIYSNFINEIGVISIRQLADQIQNSNVKFPILCLVVSGGHTQLVLMKDHLNYKIVGQTLDDAAGEAFDKVARILGLGYPGGPIISQLAAQSLKPKSKNGYGLRVTGYGIRFPRPMINSKDFNFSFSGLKTAVLYEVKKLKANKLTKLKADICCEFQQAVIDVLISKTIRAAGKYKPKTIMLAGGVSANKELRKQLGRSIKRELPDTKYQIPNTRYSVDNAVMIAAAAGFRWQKMNARQKKSLLEGWKKNETDANLKLT